MVDSEFPLNPEDFRSYYDFAPAALALRECIRLAAVRRMELEAPILDVGCGDGLFAKLAFPERTSWGIDINPSEVQRAQVSAAYATIICGNICGVDLPPAFFGSAIANCSLEHVPDITGALSNIRKSLKPGAMFALIVPTPDWADRLTTVELLKKAGLSIVAEAYADAINRVFRHVHLYGAERWIELLEDAGFESVEYSEIVSAAATRAFDLFLYPSLVGFVTKKLTGRWVVAPRFRGLSCGMARKIVNLFRHQKSQSSAAGEFVFTCRAP